MEDKLYQKQEEEGKRKKTKRENGGSEKGRQTEIMKASQMCKKACTLTCLILRHHMLRN